MENDSIMVRRFAEIRDILRNESVRGSVIIAAAEIDDQLSNLLKSRLLPCSESNDPLFDSSNSPIGNMASKIELAYRTGCIGKNLKTSLHILRKLRNDFAHLSREISFDDQSVRDRVERLFQLNSDLISLIWKGVRSEIFSISGLQETEVKGDFYKDMLHHAGHRSIFEIWSSLVAGNLAERCTEITQIQHNLK